MSLGSDAGRAAAPARPPLPGADPLRGPSSSSPSPRVSGRPESDSSSQSRGSRRRSAEPAAECRGGDGGPQGPSSGRGRALSRTPPGGEARTGLHEDTRPRPAPPRNLGKRF